MCIISNKDTDPELMAEAVRAHLRAASLQYTKFIPSRIQTRDPVSAIFLTGIPTESVNLLALTLACEEQIPDLYKDLQFSLEGGKFPTIASPQEMTKKYTAYQGNKKGPRDKLEESTVIKVKCHPNQLADCTTAFRNIFDPSKPKIDVPHCLSVMTVNDMTTDLQTPTKEATSTYNMCLAYHINATDKEKYGTLHTEIIIIRIFLKGSCVVR